MQTKMREVKKAVILSAGIGSRFLPATKTLPKEMLPIIEYPAIHYIVKELVQAGITEIVLVSRNINPVTAKYFDHDTDLENQLTKDNKTSILQKVQELNDVAHIAFIKQDPNLPYGTASAIVSAKSWIGNDNFVLVYSDDFMMSDYNPTKQLLDKFNADDESEGVLMAYEIPHEECSKYGMVETKGDSNIITSVKEKPQPEETDSNVTLIGRFIFTPKFLDYLDEKYRVNLKEFYATDCFNAMAKDHKLLVHKLEGEWITTGDPMNMLRATLAIGLKNPEYAEKVKSIIQEFEKPID